MLGFIVAAIAMVFDSSEAIRGIFERRRIRGMVSAPLPKNSANSRWGILERAEQELRRCCKRLAKDVEKEARRRAGATEITGRDITEITGRDITDAWAELVSPYESDETAERAIAATRSRKASILLGLATLAEVIAVAGVLYLIFTLVKPKLPAGQYWPAVVIIATLVILYLILINLRRVIVAMWGGLSWLARKGGAFAGNLFRVLRRDKDQDTPRSGPRVLPNAGKEGPATAEGTSDRDNGVGTSKLAGRGAIMASTSGINADKNGPGATSDALAAFAAQVAKLPAGPSPDANVAVACTLGWAVGML